MPSDAMVVHIRLDGKDNFSPAAKKATKSVVNITSAFKLLMGLGFVYKMQSWANSLIQVNVQFEKLQAKLKSIGEANPRKSALGLIGFTNRNPIFDIKYMQRAFLQFKAVGIDPLNGSLQALTDASAAFGLTSADFGKAVLAISQMMSKTVVNSEELRQQLAERIPGAAQDMAKGLGMSMKEFMKNLEQGKIAATDGLDALFSVWSKKFKGSADNMAKTWDGLMQSIWNQMRILALEIGQSGPFETLKKQLSLFLEEFKSKRGEIARIFISIFNTLKSVYKDIFGFDSAAGVVGIIKNILLAFAVFFRTMVVMVVDAVDTVKKFFSKHEALVEKIDKLFDKAAKILNAPDKAASKVYNWSHQKGYDIADYLYRSGNGNKVISPAERRRNFLGMLNSGSPSGGSPIFDAVFGNQDRSLLPRIPMRNNMIRQGSFEDIAHGYSVPRLYQGWALSPSQGKFSMGGKKSESLQERQVTATEKVAKAFEKMIEELRKPTEFQKEVAQAMTYDPATYVKRPEAKGWKAFRQGWFDTLEKVQSKFNTVVFNMKNVGIQFAETISTAFADTFEKFFLNVMEGKLGKFTDYLKNILLQVGAIMSKLAAQAMTSQLMSMFQRAPSTASGPVYTGDDFTSVSNPLPYNFSNTPGLGSTSTVGGRKARFSVNIKNESGQQVEATNASMSQDPSGMVMNIVLDSVNRNKGGSRDILKGLIR